jgi:vacuolar-type H+-ATPase subunit D/Vma8
MKLRSEQQAELKKRLDELRRNKQTGESKEALIDAYRKSEDELDKVNRDLEKQMKDLTERIKLCKD